MTTAQLNTADVELRGSVMPTPEWDLRSGIEVTLSGDTAVLKGTVRSWREREAVERAATHSLGISHLVNLLAVGEENEVG